MLNKPFRRLLFGLNLLFLFMVNFSCSNGQQGEKRSVITEKINSLIEGESSETMLNKYRLENAILVLPANPAPGEEFRILAAGGMEIKKARILVTDHAGSVKSLNGKSGNELPFWSLESFAGMNEGKYRAAIIIDGKELAYTEFEIAPRQTVAQKGVWKTTKSWNPAMETLYAAWVNALFQGCNEQTSWPNMHEVTQRKEQNLLYNHLSLNEDSPDSKIRVSMEPDCADAPFFLRAYFAWKLGLPFGYHICDRGYPGKSPGVGQSITNESPSSKSNPVQAFNTFARVLMNGVHSGTARTAFENQQSDYYPVELNRRSLLPGTVFADPYGHTLVLVSWVPQTKDKPGVLLAVDAQPDKTVAIKRFWKGNFLFNTVDVVGEPGFKAFRPMVTENGKTRLLKNEEITAESGFAPFSMQQWQMPADSFYLFMERIINPKPLDPEAALNDLVQALHEQLQVRVKSVATGEAYFKKHPGAVIPMPSSAKGVFITGGPWEDFSTPNRDLRLLIAMDAVLGFPERVAKFPEDFDVPKRSSPDALKQELQSMLDKKVSELTITYTRTDGSEQQLSMKELLDRKEAFEMAYNPNDGVEIRWGAPENSSERATCKRQAPAGQRATMQKVRTWFVKRLHPPT
ncbi:MAG TPA: hypothetical protein DER09_07355 [Prolixibacteraceae bacterium]|nr:hypothetical protein [Prolixibacteraceae bacterium]